MNKPTISWEDFIEQESERSSVFKDPETERIIGMLQNGYFRRMRGDVVFPPKTFMEYVE